MKNIYVPGIRRKRMGMHDDEHERHMPEFYYAINLQELPEAVAFGRSGYDPGNPMLRDYWTDEQLVRVLFDPTLTDNQVQPEETEAWSAARLAVANIISGCRLNAEAIAHSRDGEGFHSRMLDADGAEIGPTILWISVSRLRNAAPNGTHELGQQYGRMLSERTYEVEVASQNTTEYLETFYRNRVARVRQLNDKLREQTAPVRLALAKIHNAHLAVTAMLDFAKSPAERRRLWNESRPKEQDPWVFSSDVLPTPPTGQQVSNAEQLRDNTLEPLAEHLSRTLQWMNSGEAEQGVSWETAKHRNLAARRLLDELREDSVIGLMLDHHDRVPYHEWFVLENLLVDAFLQISTAPDVLPDLLGSEVLAMTRVAARRDCYIEAKSGVTVRERELSGVMAAMVPEIDLKEQETPLSKRLIALKDQADKVKTHGETFVKLWAAMVPPMQHMLRKIATKIGVDPSVYQRAVTIRSMFGSTPLPDKDQLSLWQSLNKVARTRDKRKALLEIFDAEKGLLRNSSRHIDNDMAWSGFKGIVALIALHETFVDGKKKPAMYTIDGMKAVLEATTAGVEFAETLTASPTFMKAASHRGESLFDALDGVSEKTWFKGLGAATAFLDLTGAVFSAKLTPTMTETEKETKAEKVLLSGMQLAVAVVSAFTVAMPVASLVLFAGQTLLLSRAQWAAKILPDVQALPGTGRFVRGVWKSLMEDKKFKALMTACPRGHSVNSILGSLKLHTSEVHQEGVSSFWSLSDGKMLHPEIVEGVLVRQYGLDEISADDIVER